MTSYLELENITKVYSSQEGVKTVLKNINLAVGKNEFLTILGPSGCGKSTLLKIIASFIKAEKGRVLKEGKEITAAGPDRLLLFQDFEQLFPWLKVIDNLVFALKAVQKLEGENKTAGKNKGAQAASKVAKKAVKSTKAELQKEALKYLKEVKLENYKDYYPYQLSGGMKQRAALARTLAAGGDIMLMDEPFGSLDSQNRQQLQQLLVDLRQQEERTIIFVSHDIREALFLADRIVVMKSEPGEIKAILKNTLPQPRQRSGEEFNRLFEKLEKLLQN